MGGYLRITTDVQQDDVFSSYGGDGGDSGTLRRAAVRRGREPVRGLRTAGPARTIYASRRRPRSIGGGGGGGAASGVDGGLPATGRLRRRRRAGLTHVDGWLRRPGARTNIRRLLRTPSVDGQASVGATPGVSATGVACVSAAPYLNFVDPGDGSLTLDFVAPQDSDGVVVTGYEVSPGRRWQLGPAHHDDGGRPHLGTVHRSGQRPGLRRRRPCGGGSDKATQGPSSAFQSATPYQRAAGPGHHLGDHLPVTGDHLLDRPRRRRQGLRRRLVDRCRWATAAARSPTRRHHLQLLLSPRAPATWSASGRSTCMDRAGTFASAEGVTVPGPAVPSPSRPRTTVTSPARPVLSPRCPRARRSPCRARATRRTPPCS